MVSAQFTLEMCVAAWNREKFTENPFWVFIDGTPGKVVINACYDKQQVCVYLQHSHARQANSGEITIS